MKNMVIAALLIVLVLTYTVPRSSAQDGSDSPYPVAPVQVEFDNDEQLVVADCYPLYSGNSETTLFVYLNSGYEGVVVYACEQLHSGLFTPIPQSTESMAYYIQ